MKRAIAEIYFLKTDQGGRTQPVPSMNFGCPVFFEGVAALSSHGYDCRMMVPEHGSAIALGETISEVVIAFLYPDDVFPYLRPGVKFRLWEGKTIGYGEILRITNG